MWWCLTYEIYTRSEIKIVNQKIRKKKEKQSNPCKTCNKTEKNCVLLLKNKSVCNVIAIIITIIERKLLNIITAVCYNNNISKTVCKGMNS